MNRPGGKVRLLPQSTPMTHKASCITLTVSALLFSSGCEDVRRFSTRPDESYCGVITLGSAFRMGLSPRVQMRLVLDANDLDEPTGPGRLWTFEAASDDRPERRLLDNAALRPMPAIAHDPLSHFEMGEAAERNAVYVVTPSDPKAEALVAFLSLRSDDGVEVRLLRPGADLPDASAEEKEARRPIFGMFSLVKREGQCGF